MRLALCLALILTAAPALGAPGKSPPRPTSAPPLALAAWKPDHDRLRALLAAGENPNAPHGIGFTPWMWSLIARDYPGFKLLFDAVRDFRPADPLAADVFLFEVGMDQRDIVRTFLDRGVSADAHANDGGHALLVAAASGLTEMVTLLLDRGAHVNVADQHGDTALMAAVRAGSVACVKALLARGAQVSARDHEGARAMTYAAGREDVQRLLREAGAAPEPKPVALAAPTAEAAVARSLPLLGKSATEWVKGGGCNACHMQPMMVRVAGVARKQGFAFDGGLLQAMETSLRKEAGPDFARYAGEVVKTEEGVAVASQYVGGDLAFNLGFTLVNVVDAGLRRPYDAASVELLARMQMPDGSFRHGPDRVPMQSGDITSTAVAGRLMKLFGHDARAARAQRWLEASAPRNVDDAAFRLLGLRWLGASPTLVAQATAALTGKQLPGGGWSQIDGLNPDAYATGLALVALAEGAGLTGTDPLYRRGADFLLRTQYPDGSWLVHKRAVPVNRYFDSGFPHGKFQFTSFIGTAWATMALMYGEPRRS
jgi:hypothetical protein